MLAKNVNDNARFLNERGVCQFFASKLAPTVSGEPLGNIASQNRNNIATKYLAGYLSTARHAVYKVTPQIRQKDD